MDVGNEFYAFIGIGLILSGIIAFSNTRKFISTSVKIFGRVEFIGVKSTSGLKAVQFAKINFNLNGKVYSTVSTISRFQKINVGD